MRSIPVALILTCLVGCATLSQDTLDQRFGHFSLLRNIGASPHVDGCLQ